MDIEQIFQYLKLLYGWIKYVVPMPWLAFLHSMVALFVGYLWGQFVLAGRLRRDGYIVNVSYDERLGRKRYFIEGNGLEFMGGYDDVDQSLFE